MKTISRIIGLVSVALPLFAGAATKSAVFQVSFEVKEACSVQSQRGVANPARPAVACQLKAPYQISRTEPATTPAASTRGNAIVTQNSTQDWTITF